jgi:hypothetical protein
MLQVMYSITLLLKYAYSCSYNTDSAFNIRYIYTYIPNRTLQHNVIRSPQSANAPLCVDDAASIT